MSKKAKPEVQSKSIVSPAITHFPSPTIEHIAPLSDEKKIELIADHFREIMQVLGLDVNNDSLNRTPYRIARMYVKEVFSGLDPKNFPDISFFQDEFHHEHKSHIVLVKVGFTSFCEHHFLPMSGIAYVAYVPSGELIGLSKIPRIVRFFAKRPQLQERMTAQIADSLAILLNSDNVAVSIAAKHYCVIARGVEDESSYTITNVLRGQFNINDTLRREFFEGINRDSLKSS
jgi:GTP cyclohydrolase I